MKKIVPFRATAKRKRRKLRETKDEIPSSSQADEEGMITVVLKDGTVKTISGKNLVADVQYKNGVPYLVVKEKL